MAEAHRESEPPKTRASKRLEGKLEASKVAETSSSGTSEGKSESSSRTTRSGESSQTSSATSVSKKSESASSATPTAPVPSKKGAVPKASVQSKKKSVAKETSPSKKEDVPQETSPSKTRTSPKTGIFGSFAKWASPPKKTTKKTPKKKTVKGSGSSAESDESPDKKDRPATISSRKKIKDTIKNVGNILFSSSSKSSKPSSIEEACLIQPEAESRHEERQASKQTELVSKYDPETWEPQNVEITGQFNLNLRGELTASYETLHPTRTDTSSLSGSVSIEVERASSLPLDRVDSREGSTGDASSLEREFEELASPSKSIQGLKRLQDRIEEEEEEDAMGISSPRKLRVMSDDKDSTEKTSDIEMD